jgi:hypothetical protein
MPPPWKGWNAIQPLAAMDPEFAILMDNMFPQPGYVELRRGHKEHSDTDTAEPVESIMAYHGLSVGDDALFAASKTSIFDVTTATPSEDVTGLTNARFQYVNFETAGGKFLWAVNGADDPQIFDGANWSTATITGVSAEDTINVNVHKNRIWGVLKDSTDAYYLPVDSIQGAATTFPLGGVFKKGGYLVAMGTWTRDGGSGPDDLAVFVSSKGEIAVYQGTDPASSDTWSIVGVFEVGNPIGLRCLLKIGSDLAIITRDGVLPMSQIPGMERGAAARIALTANIQPVLNDYTSSWASNFGWQLISYPRGTRAILNIPSVEGETQLQAVMNTVTGAWCRFTGWDANCFEVFQDRLFFGGNDGIVKEADVGGTDNGQAIRFNLKGAFNYFKQKGRQKRWTRIRPIMTTGADIVPGIGLNTDFRDDVTVIPGQASAQVTALWDDALWDVAVWPQESFFKDEWLQVMALGYCASLVMTGQVEGSETDPAILQLNAIDYEWESGGLN